VQEVAYSRGFTFQGDTMKFHSKRLSALICCTALLVAACGSDDPAPFTGAPAPAPVASAPTPPASAPTPPASAPTPPASAPTPPASAPTPPAPPAVAVGTARITVVSAATGAPIVGAKLESTAASATSAADGSATVNVASGSRRTVTVSAAGFSDNVRVLELATGASTTLRVELLPVGTTATLSVATGGDVTSGTALVRLPAASLVRNDGTTAATGNVRVELTAINPARNSAQMPGDYTATNGADPTQFAIESFGAIAVKLLADDGTKLDLAAGKTATIRIPVASRNANPPATIPLFSLNSQTGLWQQEGTATLAGTAPNRYYEGTVGHFSFWNADQRQNTVQVIGCVQDVAGAKVPNVTVSSDGIDYSGTSSARTDAAGAFSIPVRAGSTLTLQGLSGLQLTNTVSATTLAANLTLPSCLVLGTTSASLNIKLTWGAEPSDLDSHLFTPSGSHVYFADEGSLSAAPFAALDVDDVTSFGPEVITVRRLMVGTYRYSVNNYSETFTPGTTGSGTRVELNLNGVVSTFTPPAGEGTNLWWNVFSYTVDSACRVTVTPVNTWTLAAPANAPVSNPVYCTAP
jgi:uncharacterized protein YfaP (DUF2135 family)